MATRGMGTRLDLDEEVSLPNLAPPETSSIYSRYSCSQPLNSSGSSELLQTPCSMLGSLMLKPMSSPDYRCRNQRVCMLPRWDKVMWACCPLAKISPLDVRIEIDWNRTSTRWHPESVVVAVLHTRRMVEILWLLLSRIWCQGTRA